MRIAVKSGLALVGGLPAAGLFAGDANLCVAGVPRARWIILASFIVGWTGATVWATLAADARQAFRRACLSFTVAAALLPVAALVFVVTEPPSRDPIFPKTLVFFFLLAAGAVLGTMGWLLARYVPRLGDVKFSAVSGVLVVLILAIAVWFAYGIF